MQTFMWMHLKGIKGFLGSPFGSVFLTCVTNTGPDSLLLLLFLSFYYYYYFNSYFPITIFFLLYYSIFKKLFCLYIHLSIHPSTYLPIYLIFGDTLLCYS